MAAPLRVAALGLRIHAHAAIADVLAAGEVELVAVADDEASFRDEFAARYGVPAYADWREPLERHAVDLAIVMPPHDQKAEPTAACLEAGVHVLVDKTMAVTDAGLDRIAAAVARGRAELSMYLTERFGPTFIALKQIVARGDLGRVAGCAALRPHELYTSTRHRDMWITDPAHEGGVIVDLTIHDIDLVRWYTGREVAEVWARQHRAGFPELAAGWPDMGMALFVMDDGMPAMLEADWHTPRQTPWDCRFFLTGTQGAAEIKSLGFRELTIWRHEQPHQVVPTPAERTDGPGRDLIRRLRGQLPVVLTAQDALAATRAVLAARRSAETGQPVRLRL
jgi:predicted dehydrogenase